MNKNNRYIGARYVPILIGQWDATRTYEPLMIVQYQGNSFTSKTYVPIGASIDDETYWASTGNYNAQVEYYRQETKAVKDQLNVIEGKIDSANAKIILLETDVTSINEKIIVIEAALVDLNKVIDNVNTNLTKKINDDILTLSTSVTTRFSIQDIKLINVEAKLTQDINYVRAYSSKNDIPNDGITDCTAAFNKCMRTYGNIYFDADEGTVFNFATNPASISGLVIESKYPVILSVPNKKNLPFVGAVTSGNIIFRYRDSGFPNLDISFGSTTNDSFYNVKNTGFHGINYKYIADLVDKVKIRKLSGSVVVPTTSADYALSNKQNIRTITKNLLFTIPSDNNAILSAFVRNVDSGSFCCCATYGTNSEKCEFIQYGTGFTGILGITDGEYENEPYKRPWLYSLGEAFKPNDINKQFWVMAKMINSRCIAMYVNGIYCGDFVCPETIKDFGIMLRTPDTWAICFSEMGCDKLNCGFTPTIKYFGDSIGTYHGGITTPSEVITDILKNKYGMINVDVKNYSIGGELMREICARIVEDGLTYTDCIIIQGGTNDIAAGTSLTSLRESLGAVHDICVARGVKMILVYPPPRTSGEYPSKWNYMLANIDRIAFDLNNKTKYGNNLVYPVIEQLCPCTNESLYTQDVLVDTIHLSPTGLYNFSDNIANTIVNAFVK